VTETLEELWLSYNLIATLDGIQCCQNLTTLYISNNLIKAWTELDKLVRRRKRKGGGGGWCSPSYMMSSTGGGGGSSSSSSSSSSSGGGDDDAGELCTP